MKGGDYAKMDIIGRIGCHCLLLLNFTNTFKAPDQVLSESAAMTLVGSLVYLSYEMFEMNHLLRLGILLGVVCDFEPVWPLKDKGGDFTYLLTFIRVTKKAELSRLGDKSMEKDEFLKTEGPKEVEWCVGVCGINFHSN
ncbi:uncharacterized protein LOC135943496 isoform X1 [Cloeon dipterum]|uniref:uncharacterized protein LOC135943496 isoform X1 n=2 Tax=Cloeon dipterum TaxID=197152 RepID=UPI0032209D7E